MFYSKQTDYDQDSTLAHVSLLFVPLASFYVWSLTMAISAIV